jgi:MinD-like ATPase involved in chromosome partitioning or flagellar assembly
MALIAIASDKGAPGVTTAALALAAVWPRPVLLAECDPAGGDLVYRFPAADGGHLDPRRGVLSLAVVARRGMQPQQVWEHTQKLHGGLDVLAGVTNAEQGAGLSLLWGPIGKVLASLPQADVIADCGRLGADGPLYDLLAEATTVVLVTRVHVADVIRLRDRAAAFAAAAASRGRRGFGVGVVVVADHKKFRAALGEVQQVLGQANAPATVLGGIAHDVKGADLLAGEWGGNLDRTLLIKTAREVAQHLLLGLPPIASPAAVGPPIASPVTGPPAMDPQPVPAVPSLAATLTTGSADVPANELPAGARTTAGPRAAFSRVLGTRSGRHQADSGEALYASAPVADTPASNPGQARSTARHAQGSASPDPAQDQAGSTRPGGG